MDYFIGIHVEKASDGSAVVCASIWYANVKSARTTKKPPYAVVQSKRIDHGIMAAVNRVTEKLYLKGLLKAGENNYVRLVTSKKHSMGKYEKTHKLEINKKHWLIGHSKRALKDWIKNAGMST